MPIQAPQLLSWLRAAGEPSRLRLLALCEQGDLSVSDLAQALGQSEPRVCRHLRILSEAGTILLLKIGTGVLYFVAASGPAAWVGDGLSVTVPPGDADLGRDLARG